jgi:predicted RNA-binding Zn-ribbon protein involved in translation (DUF1610 family)
VTTVIGFPIELEADIEPLYPQSQLEIRRIAREYASHEIYNINQTNHVTRVMIHFYALRNHPLLRRLFYGHARCWSCGSPMHDVLVDMIRRTVQGPKAVKEELIKERPIGFYCPQCGTVRPYRYYDDSSCADD